MKRPLLVALALLAAPLVAANVSEHKVFQGNTTSTTLGYDLNDVAAPQPCQAPFTGEGCIQFESDDHHHQYLAKSLAGKHAYRLHWTMMEEKDSATSILHVVFSFAQGATKAMEGNNVNTGMWADSVDVLFHEGSGWDVSLWETTAGNIAPLGTTTQGVDSTQFHTYDFLVNTDTQTATLLDESGAVLVSSPIHHQGKGIATQWFMETGGDYWFNNNLDVRVQGDSTSIYDQDPRPPVLSNLAQNPQLVGAAQSVQVSVSVQDDWGTPSVVLHRWLNHSPAADQAMTQSGTTYTATLPGAPAGVTVGYQAEATGASGLKARTDLIEYVVASGKQPANLGGGSTPASSGLGDWTLIVFAVLSIGGVAMTFLDMASHPPGKAPNAYLYAVAGIGLGLLWLAYANNKAAVDAYLNPTTFIVAGCALAVVLLAVAGKGKRRPA